MTRMQTTVFILVAVVALVLGLTVNKVLTNSGRADPAVLLDAGIVLLPQSRGLPALTLTNQDGQPVAVDQRMRSDQQLQTTIFKLFVNDRPLRLFSRTC